MNVLPVIVRELRAQSRQPFTYWLRVIAGGIVLVIFALLILRYQRMGFGIAAPAVRGASPFSSLGAVLFGQLNATLFVCNCLLAPMLTADCISRERREGTLGLLFLTKLSAAGIVTGKSFVHALRGASLFASILPVLTIPILLGGVSAKDCAMALLIDSTVLVFALAAGLLASAFTKDWVRAFVLAEVLSVTFVMWFMFLHGDAFKDLMRGGGFIGFGYGSFLRDVAELIYFHTNLAQESSFRFGRWGTTWNDVWSTVSTARQADWFRLAAGYLTMSFMFLCAAILIAAWQVRQSWREQPAPKEIAEVQQSLTRPRFAVQRLRRRLSRGLDRNPIGWLQQYSWNARITKWGWLLLVVVAEIVLLSDLQTFDYSQRWVMLIVLAGLAFSAASSFRRERETGALELLLVCPLAVSQIILGRVRGIWMQFLPAAALATLCAFVGRGTRVFRDSQDDAALIYLVLGIAFLTIPMIGLQFSTSRLNAVAGWLCTLVLGVFVPAFAMFLVATLYSYERIPMGFSLYTVICSNLVIGGACWALLHHRLTKRRFALVAT